MMALDTCASWSKPCMALSKLEESGIKNWTLNFARRAICICNQIPAYTSGMGEDFTIIMVWVDDILMFAMTIMLRDKTKSDIESKWEIMDLGVLTKIIGIKLSISPDHIFISLSKYIESILLREGLGQSNSVSTPLNLNITLVLNPDGNVRDHSNAYTSLLGEL